MPRDPWQGVPGADVLKAYLAVAQCRERPLRDRQEAISYLTGSLKVMAELENRRPLVEHLRRELQTAKATLYR